MRGQRCPHRLAPGKAADIGAMCGTRYLGVLAGGGLQLLKLKLHLVEQLAAALGRSAEAVVPQLRDQQLQVRHHRLRPGRPGFGLAPRHLLERQRRAQRRRCRRAACRRRLA
jgi:hypothetical protein